MRQIELTRGMKCIVDDDDFESLNQFKWSASLSNGGFYAIRGEWCPDTKKTKMIRMHRQILKAKKGQFVDHIDGDTMNNRRENIRIVSNKDNVRKMGCHVGRVTKGVHLTKARSHLETPWHAYITVDNKRIHIGYYASESDAQNAYTKAAQKFYGKFANSPKEVA